MDQDIAALVQNRVFDEIAVGDKASVQRTIRPEDITLFSIISGDVNPAHLDPVYASTGMFHHIISHGVTHSRADIRCSGHQAAGSRHNLPRPEPGVSGAGKCR